MREESAGRKALNLIMGTTEKRSEGAQLRIVLLLIMLAGISFSGVALFQNKNYAPPPIIPPIVQAPAADVNRLNTMVESLNAANSARMRSMAIARDAASRPRYPFVATRAPMIPGPNILEIPQVVIIPPDVRIRGTLLIEGEAVAVLDIEGEPGGRIYRAGDRFADRRGRIVRITTDRITVIYEDREFIYIP